MDFSSFFQGIVSDLEELTQTDTTIKAESFDRIHENIKAKVNCARISATLIPPYENDYSKYLIYLQDFCAKFASTSTFLALFRTIFKVFFERFPPLLTPTFLSLFDEAKEILKGKDTAPFVNFAFKSFNPLDLGLDKCATDDLITILPNMKFSSCPKEFISFLQTFITNGKDCINAAVLFLLNCENVEVIEDLPSLLTMAASKKVTDWSSIVTLLDGTDTEQEIAWRFAEIDDEIPFEFFEHIHSDDHFLLVSSLIEKCLEIDHERGIKLIGLISQSESCLSLSAVKVLDDELRERLKSKAVRDQKLDQLRYLVRDLGDLPDYACEMIERGCLGVPDQDECILPVLNGIVRNLGRFFFSKQLDRILSMVMVLLTRISGSETDLSDLDIPLLDAIGFLFIFENPLRSLELFKKVAAIDPSRACWQRIIKANIGKLLSVKLFIKPFEANRIFEHKKPTEKCLIRDSPNRYNYILYLFKITTERIPEVKEATIQLLNSIPGFSSSAFALQSVVDDSKCDVEEAVRHFDALVQTAFVYQSHTNKGKLIDTMKTASWLNASQKALTVAFLCQGNIDEALRQKCLSLVVTLQAPFQKVYLSDGIPTQFSVLFCFALLTAVSQVEKVDRWDNDLLQCYEFLRIRAVKAIKSRGDKGTHVNVIFELLVVLLIQYSGIFDGNQIVSGFFSASQLADQVPMQIVYPSFDKLFAVISKRQKTFRRCLQTIPLTSLANFYYAAIFSLKYYNISAKNNGPLAPLVLGLVALHGRFLFVEDLTKLLSEIPWDGHKEQVPECETFIQFPQLPNVVRRHSCVPAVVQPTAHNRRLDAHDVSHYFAVRLSTMANQFVNTGLRIMCSTQKLPLQNTINNVLKPWLPFLDLSTVSQCSELLSPVFEQNCHRMILLRLIKSIFAVITTSDESDVFLKAITEYGDISSQIWVLLLRLYNDKERIVKLLIEQLVVSTKMLPIFVRIRRKFPQILTEHDFVVAIYMCFGESISENNTIAWVRDRIALLTQTNGDQLIASVLKLVNVAVTKSAVANLFTLATALPFEKRSVQDLIAAIDLNHPQLKTVMLCMLQLDCVDVVTRLSELLIKTDDEELCRAAFAHLRNAADGNSIVRCVTCGLLPVDALTHCSEGFWRDMLVDGQSLQIPSPESLNCAVIYGCDRLTEMIVLAIPNLLANGFNVEPFLNCLFDRTRVSFSRSRRILEAMPKELRHLRLNATTSEARGISLSSPAFAAEYSRLLS